MVKHEPSDLEQAVRPLWVPNYPVVMHTTLILLASMPRTEDQELSRYMGSYREDKHPVGLLEGEDVME